MSTKVKKILLTSTSAIKLQAVKRRFPEAEIETFDCVGLDLPAQPIGMKKADGFACALERMNYARRFKDFDDFDYVISIESVIHVSRDNDIAYVTIFHQDLVGFGRSFGISTNIWLPVEGSDRRFCPNDQLFQSEKIYYSQKIIGYPITLGEIIQSIDPTVDPKNWMKQIHSIDRSDQIRKGIDEALDDLHTKVFDARTIGPFRTYSDFPKPGVDFQDIFSVLEDGERLRILIGVLRDRYRHDDITHVVGLESRGFILGMPLAMELGSGFIPVRKAGKLPGPVKSIEYGTEYSKDKCEIQVNGSSNKKVLIIDDLIATGGSLKAAVDLCLEVGYQIVDCCTLIEVEALRPIAKEKMGRPYTVLLRSNQ
jgi:adenine phosphoribosyltransferase